jgi:hypothetical protein
MSAEEQIREEVGLLRSTVAGSALPTGNVVPAVGNLGGGDVEAHIAGLQADVMKLYEGLLLAGRQIDHLSDKITGIEERL